MLNLIVLFLPLLAGSIFFLLLWKLLFKDLFATRRRLTVNIREKVMPDIQKATYTQTTLSAAAIVLTFSFMQIWAEDLCHKNLLIFSWIGFCFSILIGIIASLTVIILRTHHFSTIKALEDLSETKKLAGDEKKLIDREKHLDKTLFVWVVLQPVVFFVSMVYLVLFALKNI